MREDAPPTLKPCFMCPVYNEPNQLKRVFEAAFQVVQARAVERSCKSPDLNGFTGVLLNRARVVYERAKDAPTWEDITRLHKIAGELE